ncbi:proline rich transmembrane protein 1B-like [Amphiura filiformis]|uniref:proline rich transmembrane protein 1B-like n=1 Tax=Amphiura filiformis TaxID=82378 RepID=UPI003B21D9E4
MADKNNSTDDTMQSYTYYDNPEAQSHHHEILQMTQCKSYTYYDNPEAQSHHHEGSKQGVPSQVNMARNSQAPPKDYLVIAILVTIFCCLPLGIVGIVKTSSSRTMYAMGNYEEAERSSSSARTWIKAGLICGIIVWVVQIIFIVVKIMNMNTNPDQYYGY